MRAKIQELKGKVVDLMAHPFMPKDVKDALLLALLIFEDMAIELDKLTPTINDNAPANSNSGPPYHCQTCGCIALRACARRNCGYGR